VRATGLTNVDDFAFTGNGNQVLAALFGPNQVVLVGDNGTHQTVLDPEDGLENPTAVAVRHHTVYVDGSARSTRVDLNLVPAPARPPLTSRRHYKPRYSATRSWCRPPRGLLAVVVASVSFGTAAATANSGFAAGVRLSCRAMPVASHWAACPPSRFSCATRAR